MTFLFFLTVSTWTFVIAKRHPGFIAGSLSLFISLLLLTGMFFLQIFNYPIYLLCFVLYMFLLGLILFFAIEYK